MTRLTGPALTMFHMLSEMSEDDLTKMAATIFAPDNTAENTMMFIEDVTGEDESGEVPFDMVRSLLASAIAARAVQLIEAANDATFEVMLTEMQDDHVRAIPRLIVSAIATGIPEDEARRARLARRGERIGEECQRRGLTPMNLDEDGVTMQA